jgi:DNA primase
MALPYTTYYTVQTHSDLVSLVGQYIQLIPGRKAYKGNCPFHNDSDRSLMVSAEKNIFKCFGCGAEGGPVEFIMQMTKLPLADAVNKLAGLLTIDVAVTSQFDGQTQTADRVAADQQ